MFEAVFPAMQCLESRAMYCFARTHVDQLLTRWNPETRTGEVVDDANSGTVFRIYELGQESEEQHGGVMYQDFLALDVLVSHVSLVKKRKSVAKQSKKGTELAMFGMVGPAL